MLSFLHGKIKKHKRKYRYYEALLAEYEASIESPLVVNENDPLVKDTLEKTMQEFLLLPEWLEQDHRFPFKKRCRRSSLPCSHLNFDQER